MKKPIISQEDLIPLITPASSGIPKQQHDPIVRNIEGTLRARGEDDSQPTIVVVAHYDTLGAAPSLSYGADSNGSGVIVLLELARMFSRLYKSSKTQPSVNLVFLLSAGGKFNYFGTKKWLESHLDSSSSSELLSDVKFCLCLDAIGNTHLSSKVENKEEYTEYLLLNTFGDKSSYKKIPPGTIRIFSKNLFCFFNGRYWRKLK